MASSSTIKYRFPQNVDVHEIVTVKLSDGNFVLWKKLMLTLLVSHGLVDFIKYARPTAYRGSTSASGGGINETEEDNWKKIDGLVKRWIIATVSEIIMIRMAQMDTAAAMWSDLCDTYGEPEVPERNFLENVHLNQYLPLAKAALHNDWPKAAKFLEEKPKSIRTSITCGAETALMIAVRSVKRIRFTRELVAIMKPKDLALCDASSLTALHLAADAGNIMAAKVLVEKCPSLLYDEDPQGLLPLHRAAMNNRREMVLYLMTVTKENPNIQPYDIRLLGHLLQSGLNDIALDVVQRYPRDDADDYETCLSCFLWKYAEITSEESSFNFWQRIIYSRAPVKTRNEENNNSRNREITSAFNSAREEMHGRFWKFAERSVPLVKLVIDKKLIHRQAQELLEQIVHDMIAFESFEVMQLLANTVAVATTLGVHRIVEHIMDLYPATISVKTLLGQSIFHLAILERHEKVFNIIYQLGTSQTVFMKSCDIALNTPLHAAGCLENEPKIRLRVSAAGAALQMQRELQWFEEVNKMTPLHRRHLKNSEGKTASMLFAETHQELVKEAEQWVKDTSSSCTIVAALILTVVFAAVITVPGGTNSNTGLPIHTGKNSFTVFAISNALALFSSSSSLLMFLAILTSQYSEADFLYALPKRLIIGLATLFLAIIFMMVAFSATVQILFGDLKSWVLVPLVALACIPVALFMSLQFSLLVDMIKSTYGPGIFGKQSDRVLL